MPIARIHMITTSSPDDVRELTRRIDDGEIDREKVVAVLGKTEGNGCVNEYGTSSHERVLCSDVTSRESV